MATQNPIEYEGTYTLPEAQLDRFLLRIEIGYPGGADEIRIMRRRNSVEALESLKPVLSVKEILALQNQVGEVHVEDSVANYMLEIIHATRAHEYVDLGASPRGSLALYEACQARALVEGRDFVTPDDVKLMAVPVLSHRIIAKSRGGNLVSSSRERGEIVEDILAKISPPV